MGSDRRIVEHGELGERARRLEDRREAVVCATMDGQRVTSSPSSFSVPGRRGGARRCSRAASTSRHRSARSGTSARTRRSRARRRRPPATAPNDFVTPAISHAGSGRNHRRESGRHRPRPSDVGRPTGCQSSGSRLAEVPCREPCHLEKRLAVLSGVNPSSISSSNSATARSQAARARHTLLRQRRRQRPAMVRMRVAHDQALALERVDHLAHRLRRHQRAPCELRGREGRAVPGEDAQRRELERRQTVRRHALPDADARPAAAGGRSHTRRRSSSPKRRRPA